MPIEQLKESVKEREESPYTRGASDRRTSNESRMAVLEQVILWHDKRLTDVEERQQIYHADLMRHFEEEAKQQSSIENQLTKVITTLDNVVSHMDNLSAKAETTSVMVHKHEVIGMTVLKVGGILGTIVAAIWALVQTALHYLTKLP